MHLVLVTALIAVCGADKLDRTYLPPASASTAGGSGASLQPPFRSNQGLGGLPKGGYSNDFEGVVVDAVAPGTRASGAEETGLGGPRIAYGSTDSKVGEAAFTSDAAFPRIVANSGQNRLAFSHKAEQRPERIQASRDRVSNIVRYESDVNPERFNYAFETDNGIVAEENGIEVNGVKAQGGYSYTGDDGQVYSVTYTADEDGYRPKGDHLPTPPPIPKEILESLEKNAQDEAAGVIDDGSYDAQKYNTGEDYTKSDNGQYNGGQETLFGRRPQSDPVASGTFISQNNQGFIRPNSNADKNYGISPTQNAQTGFGFASNNQYLPPTNIFNQNRRPGLNIRPTGVQSDSQTGIPPKSTSPFNTASDKDKNTAIPTFIPLAQQKLLEDKPKRPQTSFPIFGKPTLIDSSLSIKDPFGRNPSGKKFTQNKQLTQKPQPVGGSFEVVSGNVYTSKNEYLPPRQQNPRPNQFNKYQPHGFGSQFNQQFPGSQISTSNSPSASAFSSVSRPVSGYQSYQQSYGQQTPQVAVTGTGFSNQINQSPGNFPQIPQSSVSPSGFGFPTGSDFNGSLLSQSQYKPSAFAPQFPTLQPQTELTTPLESNSDRNKGTGPVPVFDGPDAPSFGSSSSFPSFGSKPSNSIIGQFSFNSDKIAPLSGSTLSDQSTVPGSQYTAEPASTLGLQSQLPNKLPGLTQFPFSTPRPTIGQFNQPQGPDDSYYYNTPSKPFNTPTPRPGSSVYPSSSFDQSTKVTQTPFGNGPQLSDEPETFFTSQSNTPTDTTRYPKPSSFRPVSPTLPTTEDEQNRFQSQVTQASSSSFPSPKPTESIGFNKNQFGQFSTQGASQPGPSFAQSTSSVQSITPGPTNYQPSIGNKKPTNQGLSTKPQQIQQYDGELYDYTKPPQTLPTPQNSATFGQFGQKPQTGSSMTSPPQIGQSQSFEVNKPSSQFGSQFTQQTPFGQQPQYPQVSQDNQSFNNNNRPGQYSPGQFNTRPSSPTQNTQPIQGASKFPPTYNKPAPVCCTQVGLPTQSSQADEPDKIAQFGDKTKPDLSQKIPDQGIKPVQSVSTFQGVQEQFGGPRKPPSFDQNGYHY